MAKLPCVSRTPIISSISPEKPIDQTLCVTFRYTSSSLSLIHLSWPMYVTRLDGTYGSVAKGSNVIR